MGEETIEGILGSLGLSDREAELYLFLAKHGVLKCGKIAKGMKRHTAQIYRLMKTLMSKGLVEATLETPGPFCCGSP